MTTTDADTLVEVLRAEVRALFARLADGARDDAAFDALAARLGDLQVAGSEVVARLAAHAGASGPGALPVAVPTDVFRYARVSVLPRAPADRVFRTSGTTAEARGEHALADLSLYAESARRSARHFLFPDVERIDLVALVPPEPEAPDSSLAYMVARFGEWFGAEVRHVVGAGGLDVAALADACARAERSGRAVALVGTSFAFVHAEDALAGRRFRLPAGSRAMQTGGFKGRSREVEAGALRAAITTRYGLAEPLVVGEYGMTELSSQLYETTLRHARVGDVPEGRAYGSMGWVRARVVDPGTLRPLPPGTRGLVRLDDLANVETAVAVLTSDVGMLDAAGRLVLLGRAAGAEARGCSIAADLLLAGGSPG